MHQLINTNIATAHWLYVDTGDVGNWAVLILDWLHAASQPIRAPRVCPGLLIWPKLEPWRKWLWRNTVGEVSYQESKSQNLRLKNPPTLYPECTLTSVVTARSWTLITKRLHVKQWGPPLHTSANISPIWPRNEHLSERGNDWVSGAINRGKSP